MVKKPPANAGDAGLIPGEGNGNSLQYSCLQKTQWTEKSGGLQSMGLQRIRHNLATEHTHTHREIYYSDQSI